MISVDPIHVVEYDVATVHAYHANKGEGIPRHEHSYAHLTICHAGSILVTKEGKSITMTKDTQPVNLVAAEWHEIEALEDGTVFVNIFAKGKR